LQHIYCTGAYACGSIQASGSDAAQKKAGEDVTAVLGVGDTVVYEAAVYPGCAAEACVPIFENASGLELTRDFAVGYSPERVNPGDKSYRLRTIRKIAPGSTPTAADCIDRLYASMITSGTRKPSEIKVAEADPVTENTARDVNIALINELALIFNRLGIDTEDVLRAPATKRNFQPFKPGLVDGHCIGVDPYDLTYKTQAIGSHPEMLLARRRLNASMESDVAGAVVRLMTTKRMHISDARVLVLGFTCKEHCPDMRNSRVIDLIRGLDTTALMSMFMIPGRTRLWPT
jgi:UDP-N-acetyl-D-galactosamine dehydrogenase